MPQSVPKCPECGWSLSITAERDDSGALVWIARCWNESCIRDPKVVKPGEEKQHASE